MSSLGVAAARWLGRTACGVVLAAAVLIGPAGAHADQPAWVVTLNRVTAFSGPNADAIAFGDMPAMVTLQVLGYDGDRARVLDPARTEDFTGRWLDVDLSTPARVTAYEGDTPVNSFLTIKGAGPRPTPTGVFTILRRVANETMNSDTIGIPRFGPGGYYLTNVLFTQYFTGDGASLHYNYWSSNWGYPGSHGCLGLTYADSAWLWSWATVGTPVDIHY